MIDVVRIYRNGRYAYTSVSLTGLLLWLFSFSLQSCSIRGRELNINPILIEALRRDLACHVNGCFPKETMAKFQRLEQEGFIGGDVPNDGYIRNNDDLRKHFMFLFCHSLALKEAGRMFENERIRNQFIYDFTRVQGSANLIWEPIAVNRQSHRRPYTVEFRLRDLLTDFGDLTVRDLDDSGVLDEERNLHIDALFALDNVQHGRAPEYLGDRVDIDHLFRDNSITIELPAFLHGQKNILIDNLIRVPRENVIRTSSNYWMNRNNRGFI
ncbi:MAG: hypothetical protein V3580_04690 [Candidatus Cardinium sp.]|nr:hypothetical protein [Candidatus Cardinium sp.]